MAVPIVESRIGNSKLQCHLDQWLIDGGMGVLEQSLVSIAFK